VDAWFAMAANDVYAVDAPNPWRLIKAVQELEARKENLVAKIAARQSAHDRKLAEIGNLRSRLDTLEASRR
jgi:hypothetical protein